MNPLPPAVISIDIRNEQNNRIRLWLPVFILWPFMVLAAALLLPLAAVAEVLLAPKKIRPFSMLLALLGVLSSLHGTYVDVVSDKPGRKELVKIIIQ